MLSEKIKTFCKEKGWWNDDYTVEYADALRKLNIDLTTDFATFFLHVEDSPTFLWQTSRTLPNMLVRNKYKLRTCYYICPQRT